MRALAGEAEQSGLARLFSLRHDFPSEWYAFATGDGDFTATLRDTHFPYFARNETIALTGARLCALADGGLRALTLDDLDLDAISDALEDEDGAVLSLPRDLEVLVADDIREVSWCSPTP